MPQSPQQQQQQQKKIATRVLEPGETLLRAGDKIGCVYMIQSGRLSLCQSKGGKSVEVSQMTAPRTLGDEWVFGPNQWQFNAIALRDTVVLEIPLEMLSEPINKGNPSLRTLLKAISERIKATGNELKTVKTSRETVACPPDNTAKVFGVIFHTARAVGSKAGDVTVADWAEFKKYAFEVFEESIVRLEDAINVLSKLGYVKLDDKTIHLMDMKQIEAFFDYYGNYHFKGGYGDLLKTNAKMQKVTEEFLKVAANHPVDRGGNAHLPYKPTIDAMKAALGSTFEADQLFRLEQKGLFIKRQTTNDGGVLSFYKPDFEQMLLNWKILRELELWNEKGYVDMSEFSAASKQLGEVNPESERKRWAQLLAGWKPMASNGVPKLRTGDKKPDEIWCSVCMSVVGKNQSVCQVCGAEIGKQAA